ncbi:MAG: hypothetical protein QMD36_04840 [Candidatus Aenigmarchaeota archaeon]|nr:hypothetical protein [Candidatus Aenigmarchaeota archaeon]
MNFANIYQAREEIMNDLYPDPLENLLGKIDPHYNRKMVQDNEKRWNILKSALLESAEHRTVYGVNENNVDYVLYKRLKLLKDVWKEFEDLRINKLKIPEDLTLRLWNVYIPFSEWIVNKRKNIPKDKAYILGINGGQGSGKSTLVAVMKLLLEKQGYTSIAASIDDYYLPLDRREKLKKRVPYFWARAPFGTHDVELGIKTFRKLKFKKPVEIPKFKKDLYDGKGDRAPKEEWQKVDRVDIVLFEGVGVGCCRPLPEQELDKPTGNELVDRIEKRDDPDGTFRRIVNREVEKYRPWFDLCDNLIVMKVPSLEKIREWRRLQEIKLREETGKGMTDKEVEKFLDYWTPPTWRYVIPLAESEDVDLVFEIGEDHDIKRVIAKK